MPSWCACAWDVWTIDWVGTASVKGNFTPDIVWAFAPGTGRQVASYFTKNYRYQHFHLITHSAGAHLIDTATPLLKSSGATVHETFLDAYDPSALLHPTFDPPRHVSQYGEQADWVDSYVDTRPLPGDIYGTGADLNADTTDLHLSTTRPTPTTTTTVCRTPGRAHTDSIPRIPPTLRRMPTTTACPIWRNSSWEPIPRRRHGPRRLAGCRRRLPSIP